MSLWTFLSMYLLYSMIAMKLMNAIVHANDKNNRKIPKHPNWKKWYFKVRQELCLIMKIFFKEINQFGLCFDYTKLSFAWNSCINFVIGWIIRLAYHSCIKLNKTAPVRQLWSAWSVMVHGVCTVHGWHACRVIHT